MEIGDLSCSPATVSQSVTIVLCFYQLQSSGKVRRPGTAQDEVLTLDHFPGMAILFHNLSRVSKWLDPGPPTLGKRIPGNVWVVSNVPVGKYQAISSTNERSNCQPIRQNICWRWSKSITRYHKSISTVRTGLSFATAGSFFGHREGGDYKERRHFIQA